MSVNLPWPNEQRRGIRGAPDERFNNWETGAIVSGTTRDNVLIHGRYSTYNRGCRCDECREACRLYTVKRRLRLATRSDAPHGTMNCYTNFGCRCEACRAVAADAWRKRKAVTA